MARTVLFIHGAWLTPASWSPFTDAFAAMDYEILAPAWPTLDRPVAEIRANPDPAFAQLGLVELVDHYAAIATALPEPPILVGHSFGGLVVQLLLDRGIGVAGVAVDPAPPWGVFARPQAVITSLPVFASWRGWRKIHTMSEKAFRSGFGNGMTPDQQTDAYHRFIVPAPGRIFFQAVFGRGSKLTWANPRRPPLLLTSGLDDRTVPPAMVRDNFRKAQRAPSQTDLLTYPDRGHFLLRQDGWQEIQADILAWLGKNAAN